MQPQHASKSMQEHAYHGQQSQAPLRMDGYKTTEKAFKNQLDSENHWKEKETTVTGHPKQKGAAHGM